MELDRHINSTAGLCARKPRSGDSQLVEAGGPNVVLEVATPSDEVLDRKIEPTGPAWID